MQTTQPKRLLPSLLGERAYAPRPRSDVAEGRPVMNDRLTVAEYLNRWLYEVAKQRTRPMTWRGYEHLVRLHILPTLGRVRLAKLTPQ